MCLFWRWLAFQNQLKNPAGLLRELGLCYLEVSLQKICVLSCFTPLQQVGTNMFPINNLIITLNQCLAVRREIILIIRWVLGFWYRVVCLFFNQALSFVKSHIFRRSKRRTTKEVTFIFLQQNSIMCSSFQTHEQTNIPHRLHHHLPY